MIEAIIFDIGGVLAFDVWEHLLLDDTQGIASLYNLDAEKVKAIGTELWEIFSTQNSEHRVDGYQALEHEYWEMFAKNLALDIPIADLIDRTDTFIKPVHHMQALVRSLHASGVKLAICSNNTEFWFERQMHQLGYVEFFNPSTIVLSCHFGVSKSKNFDMFQAVVDTLGVPKQACLFVDDRSNNIKQAGAFGLPAIFFPSHADYGHHYLELLFRALGLL